MPRVVVIPSHLPKRIDMKSPARTSHRLALALSTILAFLSVAAACGSSSDEATSSNQESSSVASASETGTQDSASESSVSENSVSENSVSESSAAANDDADAAASAFPVTVAHKYGETSLDAEPIRVISLGYSDQDDLLAFGVAPIAIRDWYGDQPFAVWPWAQDELGDATPEVMPASEINMELIASLKPDLIIGVSSGMTEDDYSTLSQIAPTLPQSGDYADWSMPWDARTLSIGTILGKQAEAQAYVDDLTARFDQIRVDHPEFTDASAAVAFSYDGSPGAYASGDARSTILRNMGFVIPSAIDDMAGASFYASFSAETIELLNVDVLAWIGSNDEAAEEILSSPLRPGLTAHTEGREVWVGGDLAGAFSFASPLSLHYLLDALVPELALAVDGDASTVVPSMDRIGGAPNN